MASKKKSFLDEIAYKNVTNREFIKNFNFIINRACDAYKKDKISGQTFLQLWLQSLSPLFSDSLESIAKMKSGKQHLILAKNVNSAKKWLSSFLSPNKKELENHTKKDLISYAQLIESLKESSLIFEKLKPDQEFLVKNKSTVGDFLTNKIPKDLKISEFSIKGINDEKLIFSSKNELTKFVNSPEFEKFKQSQKKQLERKSRFEELREKRRNEFRRRVKDRQFKRPSSIDLENSQKIMPYRDAQAYVRSLGLKNQGEYNQLVKAGNMSSLPHDPHTFYRFKWNGWSDFLKKPKGYLSYHEARRILSHAEIQSYDEWKNSWVRKREDFPNNPKKQYGKEWNGWSEFLDVDEKVSEMVDDSAHAIHDGKYLKSIEICKKIEKIDPNEPRSMFNHASALHLLDKPKRALTILNKLHKLGNPTPVTLSLLGDVFSDLNDTKSSNTAYKKSLDLFSKLKMDEEAGATPSFLKNRISKNYIKMKKYKDALTWAKSAIKDAESKSKTDKDLVDLTAAYFYHSVSLFKLKKYELAKKSLQKSIKFGREDETYDFVDVLLNALILSKMKKYNDEFFESIISAYYLEPRMKERQKTFSNMPFDVQKELQSSIKSDLKTNPKLAEWMKKKGKKFLNSKF